MVDRVVADARHGVDGLPCASLAGATPAAGDPEPGQSVALGHEALWAAQADRDHILLRREPKGGWRLINLSPGKQVLWQPAGEARYRPIRQWLLRPGAMFTVGTVPFTVQATNAQQLTLQRSPSLGIRWRSFATGRSARSRMLPWLAEPITERLGGAGPELAGAAPVAAGRRSLLCRPTGYRGGGGRYSRRDAYPHRLRVATGRGGILWFTDHDGDGNSGSGIAGAAFHSTEHRRPAHRWPYPLPGRTNHAVSGTGGAGPRPAPPR